MTRTLIIAAAFVALAAPATASEIRISIAGKDPAVVQAQIKRAARTLCRAERNSSLSLYLFHGCVTDAVAEANAQLERQAPTQLASTR